MKQKKIGFIGLGLIGGSIAKAIRRYYPDYEIVAFDKNRETLALATQESIINVACTSIDDNFRGCNYIFLCAPVAFNTAYLKQMMPYLHDDMILTDVGSVKTPAGTGGLLYRRTPDGRFRKEWFCQFQTNPDRERLLCSHPFRQSSEKKG